MGEQIIFTVTQQMGPGVLLKIQESYVEHTSDTKGGSSGAPIIDPETGRFWHPHTEIVSKGWNSGTYIGVPEFSKAISECLDWEKQNLP